MPLSHTHTYRRIIFILLGVVPEGIFKRYEFIAWWFCNFNGSHICPDNFILIYSFHHKSIQQYARSMYITNPYLQAVYHTMENQSVWFLFVVYVHCNSSNLLHVLSLIDVWNGRSLIFETHTATIYFWWIDSFRRWYIM